MKNQIVTALGIKLTEDVGEITKTFEETRANFFYLLCLFFHWFLIWQWMKSLCERQDMTSNRDFSREWWW